MLRGHYRQPIAKNAKTRCALLWVSIWLADHISLSLSRSGSAHGWLRVAIETNLLVAFLAEVLCWTSLRVLS